MNILLNVENEEDIQYLQTLSEEKKESVIKAALSIGLKSIQMSEVNMDCHSYIEPIQRIVEKSTESGKESLDSIEDKSLNVIEKPVNYEYNTLITLETDLEPSRFSKLLIDVNHPNLKINIYKKISKELSTFIKN